MRPTKDIPRIVLATLSILSGIAATQVIEHGAASQHTIEVAESAPVSFAIIGDYGLAGQAEADVAALIHSWDVDFVATVGDNNYPDGADNTLDVNVGQYYGDFIHPYAGKYGSSATSNRFFPALGNHDWRSITCDSDGCTGPYLDYFTLPGNERYYDFVWGDVHVFAIDSDPSEPDGTSSDSPQAEWLRNGLSTSTASWQVVLLHHAPFSSARHGSASRMQWPFGPWGADVVVAGHDHVYERIERDETVYIVNGLGGKSIYEFSTVEDGSVVRYNDDYGAVRATADANSLTVEFVTRGGMTIDRFEIRSPDATNVVLPHDVDLDRPVLAAAYPNPVWRTTTISYELPRPATVTMSVVDLLGRQIKTFGIGTQTAGSHEVTLDASALPAGLYFYRLETGGLVQTRSIVVLN